MFAELPSGVHLQLGGQTEAPTGPTNPPTDPEPPTDPGTACRVGMVLNPGDYCTVVIPGFNVGTDRLQVTSNGLLCYGGICFSGQRVEHTGFEATNIGGGSWRIDLVP